MPSTTNGEEVSIPAADCIPFVEKAGYPAESNLDRGVWIFWPFRDGVECFVDVSEYDEGDTIFGFNAIFQGSALPAPGASIVSRLGLEPSYAYASDNGLIVHSEEEIERSKFNPAWFESRFNNWDSGLRQLVDRMNTLR